MSTHRSLSVRRLHAPPAILFETLESRLLLSAAAFLQPISVSTSVQPAALSVTPDCDSDDPTPPPDDPTPSPPAAPSRLTIQSPSDTSAFLSWTESSGDADSFDVMRLGPTGGWKTIATIDGGRTHYLDTGLEPGATYSYALDAENAGGYSDDSSTISITLPAADPTLVGQFGKLPGGAASAPLRFLDSDGTKVSITLTGPGIGTLHLVSGGYDLDLTGTTAASHLTITTTRTRTPTDDGRFDLAEITVGDPTNAADSTTLASLTATTTDLAGNLTLTGGLGTLKLGNVTGGAITIGAPIAPAKSPSLSLTLAQVDGVTLTSAIGIKQLTAQSWLAGQITAPTLGTLSITGKHAAKGAAAILGDFGASLTLVGTPGAAVTLTKAAIANQITAGTWQIAGAVKTLAAGSVATPWTLNLTDTSASPGNLGTLTLSAKAATSTLDVTANAIGTLTVQGSLADSAITLRQPIAPKTTAITQMTIRGQFTQSDLRTLGNIKSITIGSLDHALLFAGIASGVSGLPTASADFVTDASIAALRITTLTNSDIAAASIVHAALPNKPTAVVDADQSDPFGFATLTDSVRAYQGPHSAGNYIAGMDSGVA